MPIKCVRDCPITSRIHRLGPGIVVREGSEPVSTTSVPLLIIAAGTVGFLHSILPDHWVPLAVIGRTQRWSIARVARVSFLASIGHVVTSLVIAGIIAAVGLQCRHALDT